MVSTTLLALHFLGSLLWRFPLLSKLAIRLARQRSKISLLQRRESMGWDRTGVCGADGYGRDMAFNGAAVTTEREN
ncbi:uncharacterized protein BKA78DRAFT_133370 [Phyllosticta capitalensis]|uniref:uncharacterized protein n=1 Tax=Phyllosticta capitalensis TaxID=121624 RepID=UPI00312EDAA0